MRNARKTLSVNLSVSNIYTKWTLMKQYTRLASFYVHRSHKLLRFGSLKPDFVLQFSPHATQVTSKILLVFLSRPLYLHPPRIPGPELRNLKHGPWRLGFVEVGPLKAHAWNLTLGTCKSELGEYSPLCFPGIWRMKNSTQSPVRIALKTLRASSTAACVWKRV